MSERAPELQVLSTAPDLALRRGVPIPAVCFSIGRERRVERILWRPRTSIQQWSSGGSTQHRAQWSDANGLFDGGRHSVCSMARRAGGVAAEQRAVINVI
jgi:hypothetical protein